MLMNETEFLHFIDKANSVIIYGDSQGRQLARDLLDYHYPSKIIVRTRRYVYHSEAKRTTVFPVNYKTTTKLLLDLSKALRRKRKLLIIDSFTDICDIIRKEQLQARKEDKNFALGFKNFEKLIEFFLDNSLTWKKKYILFCDEKTDVLKPSEIKMRIHWRITLRVDGIIRFKDNQIILERDRLG